MQINAELKTIKLTH